MCASRGRHVSGGPTLVDMSPALPTAHERCGKMGTLEKNGSSKPLSFDGKDASWSSFKKALHQPAAPRQGGMWLGSGRRERLLRHAKSSSRQGGQEHHDILKRHSLNKCR